MTLRKGFTLIEIMVVLAILAILATRLVPKIMHNVDDAKIKVAKLDIQTISDALMRYKVHNGYYPTTEQGLSALIKEPVTEPLPRAWQPGGYLPEDATFKDPWENPYVYRSPGEKKDFDILSYGADGKPGGTGYNADITN